MSRITLADAAQATGCTPAAVGTKRHLLLASRARAPANRHYLLLAAAAAASVFTTSTYANEGVDAAPFVKIISKEELERCVSALFRVCGA